MMTTMPRITRWLLAPALVGVLADVGRAEGDAAAVTTLADVAADWQAARPLPGGNDLNPRTGFGLSPDRRFLFLVTIVGRQPESRGATTEELGTLLAGVGAADGINMDGGGSTTLAWWNPATDAAELLNQPVGDGAAWPKAADPATFRPTERTNGNNFGVVSGPPRE
jgi:hypothetical protein